MEIANGRDPGRTYAAVLGEMAEVPVMLFRVPAVDDPLEPAGGVAALLRAGDNWAPRAKVAQERKGAAQTV